MRRIPTAADIEPVDESTTYLVWIAVLIMCYLMVQCVLILLAKYCNRNIATHNLAVEAITMRKAYYDSLRDLDEEDFNVDISD
ncbi:hypothetical protein [Poriferisphaera sp. WC338]|uniref:hypothetical protein n=1 Tax=Poriferisphaera sp. WC338 TaxID=3425129 RepID=UPI003D816995